jgi:hypothetical protein
MADVVLQETRRAPCARELRRSLCPGVELVAAHAIISRGVFDGGMARQPRWSTMGARCCALLHPQLRKHLAGAMTLDRGLSARLH